MKLFSKDKGIILLILNAVLIIWLMISIVISVANITNTLIKDYEYDYKEYKEVYCYYYEEYDDKDGMITNEEYVDRTCKSEYASYKLNNKEMELSRKRSLIISISSIILSAIVLLVLNLKSKDKK